MAASMSSERSSQTPTGLPSPAPRRAGGARGGSPGAPARRRSRSHPRRSRADGLGPRPPAARTARGGPDRRSHSRRGVVPLREDLLALLRSAAAEASASRRPGLRDQAVQEDLQMPRRSAAAVGTARTGRWRTRACRRAVPRSSTKTKERSNLAMPVGELLGRRARTPLEAGLRQGRVLERQHHLEQRRAGEVALRVQLVDQLLEGEVLVGVGPQAHLPHLAQQVAEARRPATGRPAAPGC